MQASDTPAERRPPPVSIPPSSVPPNSGPPGGFSNFVPPPSRPAKGGGWKIFGIGCLVLFLAAAIGGIILVRNVKNAMTHPDKSSVLGVGVLAGQAGLQGAQLRQAIVAYHAQKGRYPKTLTDLVVDGSIDGKLLHNDLDDNPNPGHVSWRYEPPAEGAPGTTPILTEPYQITVGGQKTPGQIAITLDGKSVSGSSGNRR